MSSQMYWLEIAEAIEALGKIKEDLEYAFIDYYNEQRKDFATERLNAKVLEDLYKYLFGESFPRELADQRYEAKKE